MSSDNDIGFLWYIKRKKTVKYFWKNDKRKERFLPNADIVDREFG